MAGSILRAERWAHVVEDVVVRRIPDRATDVAHAQSDGGDGGDELSRANDLGNDAAGDDDAANAERCESHDDIHGADVVRVADGDGAAESGHHGGSHDHDGFDAAFGDRDQE